MTVRDSALKKFRRVNKLIASLDSQCKSLLTKGIVELDKAKQYALASNQPVEEFSISNVEMDDLGLQINEIRFLVHVGIIKSIEEVEKKGIHRNFGLSPDIVGNRVCYVLTDLGSLVAGKLKNETEIAGREWNPHRLQPASSFANARPKWDSSTRVLKISELVIKLFRVPAINQETVLNAFQEEEWPVKVLDPLPYNEEICPKQRLHDTIKCLNRGHANTNLIRFHGDGTGQGVYWDRCGTG